MSFVIPIEVSTKNKVFTVSWENLNSDLQISDFILERSDDGGNTFKRVTKSPFKKFFFAEDGLDLSKEYQYRLKYKLLSGEESDYSYSVFIRPRDKRTGFGFANPDLTSNHHAEGWGLLVTPDEMRHMASWGNDLVSPGGLTYEDYTLQEYVDRAIADVESFLSMDIVKRQLRHTPERDTNGNLVQRTEIPEGERFEWDDPYDYRADRARNYMYIKLRRRPVIEIQKCVMLNPYGGMIVDLLKWAKINHFYGSIEFFPYRGAIMTLPFVSYASGNNYMPFSYLNDYPDAYYIDYTTGYERADKVPADLRQLVYLLAAINLLNDYGDGRAAAIASASISLGGISESYSTTMSATSAMFGARIQTYYKQIEMWLKNNAAKYRGIQIGCAGVG